MYIYGTTNSLPGTNIVIDDSNFDALTGTDAQTLFDDIDDQLLDIYSLISAIHDPVTLVGSPNYITISGQVITRNLINLGSHVTGSLPQASVTNLVTDLANKQPLDTDLTNIAALSTTGFPARTNVSGTWALRTLTAGLSVSITNPAGVAGNPTISVAIDKGGGEALSKNALGAIAATELVRHEVDSSFTGNDTSLFAENAKDNHDIITVRKAKITATGDHYKSLDQDLQTQWAIRYNGAMKPAQLSDADAPNDSIYYSLDAGVLVYKDSGGTVNNLY